MSASETIIFFIRRQGRHYVIEDTDGDLMIELKFDTIGAAENMAVRFAQDVGALWCIHAPVHPPS